MTLWFATPHIPLMDTPSTAYDDSGVSEERRSYYEAIQSMDAQIGNLRGLLAELDADRRTLVMFTADNGPESAEVGSTGGLRGEKRALYEGGLRVPTLVEWPGQVEPGAASSAMATTSDLLPTLLGVWRVAMPDARPLDGESLLDVLQGRDSGRAEGYTFCSVHGRSQMAMGERFKLVTEEGSTEHELYDLLEDPKEQHNLLEQPTPYAEAQARRLHERLTKWLESCEISRRGEDLPPRATALEHGEVRTDAELSLPFVEIGEDRFGGVVYEDRYQLTDGVFERSGVVSLFAERQFATLAAPLSVERPDRSAKERHEPPRRDLPAGATVHSYLAHYDPAGAGRGAQTARFAFDDPILGVIAEPGDLADSDSLAFAEPGFSSREGADSERGAVRWRIDDGRRSITLWMSAPPGEVRQVRILTRATIPTAGAPAEGAGQGG